MRSIRTLWAIPDLKSNDCRSFNQWTKSSPANEPRDLHSMSYAVNEPLHLHSGGPYHCQPNKYKLYQLPPKWALPSPTFSNFPTNNMEISYQWAAQSPTNEMHNLLPNEPRQFLWILPHIMYYFISKFQYLSNSLTDKFQKDSNMSIVK